jgi:photosystem II stability/assembly factor-like uncharacterized protein
MILEDESYSWWLNKRSLLRTIWQFLLCLTLFGTFPAYSQEIHRLPGARTECIAIDPHSNGQILYAAPTDSIGLFKSTDGGDRWVHITGGAHPLEEGSAYIKQILVLPYDTGVVLAGSSLVQIGVYRSTNGGFDWFQVLPVSIQGQAMMQLSDHSVYCAETGSEGKLWKSTDLGKTWDTVARFDGRPAVCTIAAQPGNENIFIAGKEGGEIYRSIDRGRSWTLTHEGDTTIGIADVPNIVFNPHNPSIVFGTLYQFPGKSLIKSTDAGLTWNTLPLPKDEWALEIDCSNPDRMWLGRFTGLNPAGAHLLESTDGGNTWLPIGLDTVVDIWMIKYDTSSGLLAVATSEGIYLRHTKSSSVRADLKEKAHLVYPNPASSSVRLNLTGLHAARVIDLAGRIMWRSSEHSKPLVEIMTGHWPPGVYSLVSSGEVRTNSRFVVMH